MNKLFTKIAAACVTAAMAVGVGIALASTEKSVLQVRASDNTETYTLTGLTDKADYNGETKTYSSVVASTGTGTNHPKYYNNGTATRFYTNNTLTISASTGYYVDSIKLTSSNNTLGNFSPDTGAYSSGSWSGGANSVVFSVSAAARLTKIEVGTTAGTPPSPSGDVEIYTITASNLSGWNSTQGSQSGTSSTFSLTGSDAALNTQIRNYSGSTLTLTSTAGEMTKAEFTCTESGTNNYGPGKMSLKTGSAGSYSYSDKVGTWTGQSNTFSLVGGQSRITSIKITYIKADVGDPTEIVCDNQSINVAQSVNLANATSILPVGAETDLSFAIKSGSSFVDLSTSGIVFGKKSGSAVVTITPAITSGGATAIDVTITVNAIPAPGISAGDNYVIYAIDSTNSYNGELTGVSSNLGTVAQFTGDVPACNYVLSIENGYCENTVAFKNGSNYLSYWGSNNELKTSSTLSAETSWIVTYDSSTKAATILNAANNLRSLQFVYNNGNPRFACYTTSQVAVKLYKYVEKALVDFTIDSSIDVYKGDTGTINVTYDPADASDKTLTWTSSDTSIATVTDGVVTGVAVGATTVSASKVISGSTVTRTCTVNVLNNVAAHRGTLADPFDVNDAIEVAKGVFVEDPDGNPISNSNPYYVTGLMTANVSRTTGQLTFWIGDNDTEVSAATGGFEVYKAAKVYGTELSTYYSANSEVTRDFNIGHYVTVYSTFTVYNGTPETTQNVADIVWNNYIEAREYAEAFNTATDAICTTDNTTDLEALELEWSTQSTAYSALSQKAKDVLVDETPSQAANAYATKKCVAQYDWIVGRYELSDFMGRNPASVGRINDSLFAMNAETSTAVIVIIAVTSITTIGAIFFIKRRKYN